MGVALVVKGADFSANPLGFISPVADSLEYLNFFGDNGASPLRNLAPGKSAAQAIGSVAPLAGQTYARMNFTNYVRTPTVETDAFTLISIYGQDTLANNTFGYAIGSFNGDATTGGANLILDQTAPHPGSTYVGRNNGSAQTPEQLTLNTSSASFAFYATRGASGVATVLTDHTRGAVLVGGTTGARTMSGQQYTIGRAPANNSVAGGNINIVFSAIFSRVLSDKEMAAFYARIKAVVQTRYALAI